MKTLGYYNGEVDLLENIKVPMLDRGCYFGDGVYEATLARNRHIFAIDEHIERIFQSARLVEINIPCSKEEMKQTLQKMVDQMDDEEVIVYWQITRGSGIRNHVYPADMVGNFWIMITPKQIGEKDRSLKLVSMPDTRYLHNNVKTLNLIPAVLYGTKAHNEGYDECVLHRDGRVTECSHSNLSMLKDGCFYTAPCDALILGGIARKHLIEACHHLNIKVVEHPFTLAQLFEADEIIVSSSGSLCAYVESIDGKPVGGKDRSLFHALQDYIYDEFYQATK